MPIRLSDEETHAFFDSADAPAPQLDLLATAGFRAAAAALRLGVFETLAEDDADRGSTAAELAARLGTDPAATSYLLEALESFGYVCQQHGSQQQSATWTLSETARRWLRPPEGEGFDFTAVVEFWSLQLFELWNDLEGTIRRGQPGLHLYSWLDERPAAQRVFQTMLGQLAELNGDEILGHLRLDASASSTPQPPRLIDIGGGHGRHALAFCRRVDGATATIVDLPSSLEVAQENAEAAGLAERVELLAADFLRDDLSGNGGSYDVAYLLSIVHSFPAETNLDLLRRVRDLLRPGGRLVVLEQLAGEERPELPAVAEAFHRIFRLNLFHLLGGRTYTLAEVRGWLEQSGLDIETSTVLESTGDNLLVARRPH